jgi:hypothetical protein
VTVDNHIRFLILIRGKVRRVIGKISIKEPLVEIDALVSSRIDALRHEQQMAAAPGRKRPEV